MIYKIKKLLLIIPVFAILFSCGKGNKQSEYVDDNPKNTLKQEDRAGDNKLKEKPADDNITQKEPLENTDNKTKDEKQSDNKTYKNSFQTEKPVAVISPLDAGEYNGKTVTVKGFVADIYKSDKVAYLNFVEKYPNNPFTAVIFASKFNDFPDISKYRNKDVEVTGRVSFFKGKPQIILNEVSQIKLKD